MQGIQIYEYQVLSGSYQSVQMQLSIQTRARRVSGRHYPFFVSRQSLTQCFAVTLSPVTFSTYCLALLKC